MTRTLKSILKFTRKTEILWRYLHNLSPSIHYATSGGNRLSIIENDIIRELSHQGIVITSIDALFAGNSDCNELYSSAADLLKTKKTEIEALHANSNKPPSIGSKTFNLEMLGSEPSFDPESVFALFALDKCLLNIANAYFRMFAILRYYNVWYTAASLSAARESQLWHFDREDNYILKVFLYLDDVDEEAGPFTYACGTHKKGRHRHVEPEYFMEGPVRRSTDEQMREVLPEENWVKAIGKKGTIVFADTRGFHKGGEARTKDRLIYTCMYTSPASESKRLIKFPPNLDAGLLTKEQLRALEII